MAYRYIPDNGVSIKFIDTKSNGKIIYARAFTFADKDDKGIIENHKVVSELFKSKVNICVAKELTKLHENFFRGNAKEILDLFYENNELLKGEFVLLLHFEKRELDYSIADKVFKNLKSNISIKEISKLASDLTGINKNLLYKRFLSFSQKT